MQVVQLFFKDRNQQHLQACDRLTVYRGYGIAGDTHAIPGSPRQLLLVGTPTLDRFALNPGQLQENVLVSGAIETLTSGQTLQLGKTALIRLTFNCEPCALLDRLQPGLAKRIRSKRGMLGMVVQDGEIRVGDRITLTPHRFPELPEAAKERFQEFVCRIPPGQVVRTSDVLLALGVTASYYRVIPTFIKKAPAHLPIHRIVTANCQLLVQCIPQQRERLLAEGVWVEGDRIPDDYVWEPMAFHPLTAL